MMLNRIEAPLSQKDACKQTFDLPYIHISIRSPHTKKPILASDPNRKAVLYLLFHDVDKIEGSLQQALHEMCGKAKPVLFSEAQAKMILRFVEKWKDQVESIVINCEAGISRSAGVAAAIAAIYQLDDTPAYRGKAPNVHVKSTLMKVANNK